MPCSRAPLLVLATAVLGGCGSDFHFYDTVDEQFDFRIFGAHSTHLHGPYVVGASFTIGVDDDHGRDNEDFRGCELRSRDEDVIAIDVSDDEEHQIEASVRALGAGVAEVELVGPDGSVWATHAIDVRVPDRVELAAAAPLFLRRHDVDPVVDDARVLTGGLATFQVRYFDGDTSLAGSGALTVHDDVATVDRTLWDEERDWLRIAPTDAGVHEIELVAGGEPFTTIAITAVEPDAVADIELRGQDEGHHDDGDWLVVIAQAFDDAGERIFGVEYDWEIAGAPQSERGDMYRYELDRSQRKTAIARFDGNEVSAVIHADEGYVDSSNDIGCSVGGRSGWAGLFALALLGIRVRRRS
jgi:hypothetical protein